MERSVLGRGLSALIPEGVQDKARAQAIAIDQIEASPYQPRHYFSEHRLRELAESIREKGIIQPILVRPKGGRYEIIAGERRYRAAKLAGLTEVPVVVKEVADGDLLELSLIENIQREELSRIEEAKAYKRLSEEFNMTHEAIARRVSKDRATITNMLRLLELPAEVQNRLDEGVLSMGHARAILGLETPDERIRACEAVIRKGLSVRQCEYLVRRRIGGGDRSRARRNKDVYLSSVEEALQHHFGTRVLIQQGKKRGRIVIEYFSLDDLNRVLEKITSVQQKRS